MGCAGWIFQAVAETCRKTLDKPWRVLNPADTVPKAQLRIALPSMRVQSDL
jgi:hypothetical protein